MPPTVSIIVPIFNQEPVLAECLGNLVHQTLEHIEIILVNDASTDNSISIIRQCESQFPDIVKVIDSPKNLGPGGARNLGIEAARGQYIGFADSDDLTDPSMYEKLYHAAIESGYDVIDCGYYCEEKDLAILHTPDDCTGILDHKKRMELIVSGGYVFSKLYRRELFQNKELRFRTNVILEDSDFITYLYATVTSIGNIKDILYFYRNRSGSASKITQTEKYYKNVYEAMKQIHLKTYKLTNYNSIQPAIEYELIQMYSYGINICLKSYLNNETYDFVSMLTNLAHLKQNIVQRTYENTYVLAKIEPLDIEIMKHNDSSPKELLNIIR